MQLFFIHHKWINGAKKSVASSSETIEVNSFLHKQLHGVLEFSGDEVRLNSGKPSFKEQR